MQQSACFEDFVVSVICSACGRDPCSLSPLTQVLELQIDSVRMLSIASQVEATFNLSFSVDDLLSFFLADRIEDLVALMKKDLR